MVVFIDEVEEIAGLRQPRTVTVTQGVTNEMLKLIPPFRERDERLLGFPGEVAVILGAVAALCCYWRDGPGLAVGRGAQNDHLGGCTAERSSPAAQNEPPAGGARRRSAGY